MKSVRTRETFRVELMVVAGLSLFFGALALATVTASRKNSAQAKLYAVTYIVSGKPKTKWVTIRYVDYLNDAGAYDKSVLPFAKVPAATLPWRLTVNLSAKSRALVEVVDDGERGGEMKASIRVNGQQKISTWGRSGGINSSYLLSNEQSYEENVGR
jgi:hypothetical protein